MTPTREPCAITYIYIYYIIVTYNDCTLVLYIIHIFASICSPHTDRRSVRAVVSCHTSRSVEKPSCAAQNESKQRLTKQSYLMTSSAPFGRGHSLSLSAAAVVVVVVVAAAPRRAAVSTRRRPTAAAALVVARALVAPARSEKKLLVARGFRRWRDAGARALTARAWREALLLFAGGAA